ncbi:MAG: tetratricopeptide repeat protein [Chitinispirillaceae bacterium]|nr:tetratricopeptide repeat protein [Chitinispirillaceae bacterium]
MKKITILILLVFLGKAVMAGPLQAKADAAYNAGKYKDAVVLYKKAALDGENRAICYFNCANAYFQLDSLPQCVVYYKAALNFAPDFFRGHLNLAIVYFTLEDIGECIASLSRALELKPDDDKALLIQAVCFRKAGAIPDAVVAFERLAAQYPDKDESYIALAEMYRDLDDNETAIAWLMKYPDAGENEIYVDYMLSDMYEQDNNFERALYYVKRTLEKEPQNRSLYYRICILLEKTGNDLVALEEARKGIELFPDFGDLAVFGGNIAVKYEKLDVAQRLYTIADQAGNPYGIVGLENVRKMRLGRVASEE